MRIHPSRLLSSSARQVLRAWLILFLTAGVHAQQPPPAPPAPPPPATAPAATPKPITKEQTIYVPFEDLASVFENQERGVFLPYREFLEMWNKLNLPEKLRKQPPPVEGVLAAATYVGKAEGKVATFSAKLSFEALKEGWSKLALGAPGLAIAEAKSKAVLASTKDGYEILFPEKGTYTVDATIYGEIVREAGRATLVLPLPKTAASQFELTIPEKGLEFTIQPAAAYSAVENPDGSTKLLVYFGAAEKVSISWTRRAGETSALKPLLFAEVRTEMHLGPGAVRTEAELKYRILRAGVSTLEVSVPQDQQVLAVEGENIRDWTVDPPAPNAPAGAAMQRIRVNLHTPARDTYALRVKLERALPPLPQQLPFPLIRAEQAERQAGTIALYTAPELTTEVTGLQELTQQAFTGAKSQGENAGEYRYLHLPYAGTIALAEAKPQVEIASETLLVVEPDRAEVRALFNATIKRTGIFGLEIELPAGYGHVEAIGPEVESFSVQNAAGKDVLSVKFRNRRTGNFSITVTADAAREKPESPIAVPVFVPRVERHEAKVGVAIHVSLKANTADRGELREEDARDLIKIPPPKPQTTPLVLGFRYRGAAKPAQVQFELRKPRVSAQVLTLLELREALLRHSWTVQYTVEYAGINELAIAVPVEIADDLQIEGADIKERTRIEPAKAGEPVTWRVTLQTKVLGSYSLNVSHDTPRAEQKPGEAAPVALHELRVLNVFRETGQVAVVKDGNIEIVKNEPKALELIDPKELDPALQRDGIFLAFKYTAHPLALRLEVSKNLFLPVPSAVVSYAVLTSVISEDEAETTEAIHWVRNNGQQFFSVQLPGEGKSAARLLSDAFVAGQPQQPSRRPDRHELLIRLPSRRDDREAFPVRFVYERPSAHPGRKLGWRGTLQLQPPKLADIETLQSKWTIYLPPDQRYVRFDGAMREPARERGWDVFRSGLDLFVPQFGPLGPGPGSAEEAEPPPLPPPSAPGFDTQLQKEGVPVTLRRLGEPAPVAIAYRGKGYAATAEVIAFIIALACGSALIGRSRGERFAYFVIVGLGALVIAGAKDPRGAGFWQAIYLGVFMAAIGWVAIGLWRRLVRIGKWRPAWRRKPPTATPPPQPASPEEV